MPDAAEIEESVSVQTETRRILGVSVETKTDIIKNHADEFSNLNFDHV